MTTDYIKSSLEQTRARIQQAERSSSREAGSVSLLAVSKTFPASAVQSAYDAGQRDFGENYLQDALFKIEALSNLKDILWHFIGPLQSNKSRAVAEHFHWLHSLDRLKIAQRLSEQRPDSMPPLQVLLQVNVSQDPNKSGVAVADVFELAAQVVQLDNLNLRGIMTIPAQHEDAGELRQDFLQMQALFERLQQRYPQIDTLSMGMSGDLELAVACGSTCVRVGTAIFGARGVQSRG